MITSQFLPQSLTDAIADLPEVTNEAIQDGFQLQHRYVPLTNTFDVLCVDQLRTVRLANGLRPYHLPLPTAGTTIAPFETFQRQFSVPAGSWLLGFVTSGADIGSLNRRMSIKDSCTGLPLFSDFIGGRALYTGAETPLGVQLLAAPRLIGDPGTIDIEITQIADATVSIYVVLLFATPVVSLPVRRNNAPGGIR